MKISELIEELQQILISDGDLIVGSKSITLHAPKIYAHYSGYGYTQVHCFDENFNDIKLVKCSRSNKLFIECGEIIVSEYKEIPH